MRTEFLCNFILRVASGPRVTLASCKSALNPPVVYSTDRSKAVDWVLVLLFVACGSFYEAICFIALCYFVLVFFSPFSIAITLLGEERAKLSAFRTFVRFAHIWFFLFLLPLGIWDRLRLVIVALPGLSFTFFFAISNTSSATLFWWRIVTIPLRLIPEEQLSLTGKSLCSKYWLIA